MSSPIGVRHLTALIAISGAVAVAPADAEPAADPTSIWTLQEENASITTSQFNDKYYVNGLKLGWTSPTDQDIPGFIATIGHDLWGTGQQRLALSLEQSFYTPADTVLVPPDPHDRPYAGVLLADATLIQDTDSTRRVFGVQLGLIGPDAGGESIQNGFHDVIGFGHTKGWAYQIQDQPLLELLDQQTWRFSTGEIGGLDTEFLPTLEAGLGNLRVYGLAGSIVRIGQDLDADFGPARLQPGISGADAYHATLPFGWYVFAGVDGQAVGYDATINGTAFRSSPSATLVPWIGEFEGGLAVMAFGTRLSYTQVIQTEEVRGQHGGLHQFGSLTLSAHF
jgi:hypothetical protein